MSSEREARWDDWEDAALLFLQQEGLTEVARNYRIREGEIDLIMRDQTHLIFVEVRQRKPSRFGNAAATVSVSKQQKLLRAAAAFLQEHKNLRELPCRFDVLAYNGNHLQNTRPYWIKNAFGE